MPEVGSWKERGRLSAMAEDFVPLCSGHRLRRNASSHMFTIGMAVPTAGTLQFSPLFLWETLAVPSREKPQKANALHGELVEDVHSEDVHSPDAHVTPARNTLDMIEVLICFDLLTWHGVLFDGQTQVPMGGCGGGPSPYLAKGLGSSAAVPRGSMNLFRFFRADYFRYDMIREGDRLLVGLSGGKEQKVKNIVQHCATSENFYLTGFDHVACFHDGCSVGIWNLKRRSPLMQDSLTLLHVLLELQRRSPVKFTVAAATVNPETPEFAPEPLIDTWCAASCCKSG
eukprot:s221_g33.t1